MSHSINKLWVLQGYRTHHKHPSSIGNGILSDTIESVDNRCNKSAAEA
jgi:hypothetical protein